MITIDALYEYRANSKTEADDIIKQLNSKGFLVSNGVKIKNVKKIFVKRLEYWTNPKYNTKVNISDIKKHGTNKLIDDGIKLTRDNGNGVGDYATVRGDNCTIIGDYATVHGDSCIATGDHTNIYGDNCTVIGDHATVHGDNCTIIGDHATVHGDNCTNMGDHATIYGDNCTNTGDYESIYGDNCTQIRKETKFYNIKTKEKTNKRNKIKNSRSFKKRKLKKKKPLKIYCDETKHSWNNLDETGTKFGNFILNGLFKSISLSNSGKTIVVNGKKFEFDGYVLTHDTNRITQSISFPDFQVYKENGNVYITDNSKRPQKYFFDY